MKRSPAKRPRASKDQPSLPDLSAGKVEARVRRKAAAAVTPPSPAKRQVWSGVKRKNQVSSLQLHLPGLGGIIQ